MHEEQNKHTNKYSKQDLGVSGWYIFQACTGCDLDIHHWKFVKYLQLKPEDKGNFKIVSSIFNGEVAPLKTLQCGHLNRTCNLVISTDLLIWKRMISLVPTSNKDSQTYLDAERISPL